MVDELYELYKDTRECEFNKRLQKGWGLCYFEYIMIKYETNDLQ